MKKINKNVFLILRSDEPFKLVVVKAADELDETVSEFIRVAIIKRLNGKKESRN